MIFRISIKTFSDTFAGYLPCTTRRRERKAEEHGALRTLVTAPLNAPFPSTRPPSHPSSKRSSSTRHQISNTSPSSSSRRELELGRGPRRARTGRRSRKGYYELAPGKEHHHDPLQSHWDAEEEDGQPTPQPTAVKRFIASAFGAHGNVTQPLCLVVRAGVPRRVSNRIANPCLWRLQIMSSIMLLVWLATSFLPRDSLPALGHAQPPTVEGKVENVIVLGGWLAGWGGAILNSELPASKNSATRQADTDPPQTFRGLISCTSAFVHVVQKELKPGSSLA